MKHRQNRQVAMRPRSNKDLGGDLSINAINLFIERKVEEGVKELKKRFWPYTLIMLFVGALGMWGLFKGITNDIKARLTSAYVAETLEKHIREFTDEKVADVADRRIFFAETRIIDGFKKEVAKQEALLIKSSTAAETQIQSLQSTLEVMNMAYDARGGDRRAFVKIAELATNRTDAGEIASKVIREIQASYEDRKEKERIGFMGVIKRTVAYNGNNGKHGPISLAEASMLLVSHNRDLEQGAINRLADSRQKEFVDLLMLAISETDSLDSIYVALRGIEKMTDVSFPALGVGEVNSWWESNKNNPEYHSPYKTAWTILFRNQVQPQPNESDADYYKRVVIPLHDAVVAKTDLQSVARDTLPIAFALGLTLKGKLDGIDCLRITKDMIAHLGNDAISRRIAFCYTAKTMALYENVATETLFNFVIRAVKAHPDYLEELKGQEVFTPIFKERVESTVRILEEHTKPIHFLCVMNHLPNGEVKFLSNISDETGTLHDLDLLVKKDSTFIVQSANHLEIPDGEVGCIRFKTDNKEGCILLLNDTGIPHLFDVQVGNERPAYRPEERRK